MCPGVSLGVLGCPGGILGCPGVIRPQRITKMMKTLPWLASIMKSKVSTVIPIFVAGYTFRGKQLSHFHICLPFH